MTKCRICPNTIEWNGLGRRPSYCSGACRQQAYRNREFESHRYAAEIACPTCATRVHPSRLTAKGRALCTKLGLLGKCSACGQQGTMVGNRLCSSCKTARRRTPQQ